MATCAIVPLYFQHEWDEVSIPLASGPLGDDMVLTVAEQEAIVKLQCCPSELIHSKIQRLLTLDYT
jgi:hypothetical protein